MSQYSSEENKRGKSDNRLLNSISNIYGKIIYGEEKTEEEQLLESIRMAHEEWKNAEKYFQNVTDPDLIDHAIYRIEAARTRYTYLLKLAKEMGIQGEMY